MTRRGRDSRRATKKKGVLATISTTTKADGSFWLGIRLTDGEDEDWQEFGPFDTEAERRDFLDWFADFSNAMGGETIPRRRN